MPPLSVSPYKPARAVNIGLDRVRGRSTSPLPPALPPKAIDLNSSTRSTDRESGAKITRRAFLCDVVVEHQGEETAGLLAQLGQPLPPQSTLPAPPPPKLSRPVTPSRGGCTEDYEYEQGEASAAQQWSPGKRAETEKRLASLIEELVRTERSYLSRIRALKQAYADPLRTFAKDVNTRIIPLYEAKNLFANVDEIVTASSAFLSDLEEIWAAGLGSQAVGEVCLRHLKDLKSFDPYRTYLSKQDECQKMFQDVLKKYTGFSSFIESTKYQTTGIGNIGLRELLMEPVQRIPRYTLLWQTMLKCLPPSSTQHAQLVESIEIASRIAKCEPDAATVRATVMYCLERNIDGFPANIFNSKRDYIDSIDVDDMPAEYPNGPSRGLSHSSRPVSSMSSTSTSTPSLTSMSSAASSSAMPVSPSGPQPASINPLHCTLFLFDDKLMIAKRQSSSISGRKVAGLDDVQKLVKTGGGVAIRAKDGAKKDKLSYRGIVDVMDIIASDVGNGDFHLFLQRPPADQTDRWAGRPFRSYTTVNPPFTSSLDPVTVRKDKLRFVENLWAAQAYARSKALAQERRHGPRVMSSGQEIGLDSAGEAFARAKCFWNVWDSENWMQQEKKARVVVQIDEEGMSQDLPLSEDAGPCLAIRLQPMPGDLCRFSYTSLAEDQDARLLLPTSEVVDKIATTIGRYGIFKFRTAANSAPTTPSSHGHRLRPSMLNLDTISRNLFGAGSVSSRSTHSDLFSTTSSKRKVGVSRSSTMETGKYSMMSGSSDGGGRSSEERHRASRASASPSERSIMEDEPSAPTGASPYKSDMRESEVDLNERLNMARKNSKSMARLTSPPPLLAAASSRLSAKSVIELRTMAEMQAVTEKRIDTWSAESSRVISKETITEQEVEEWSFTLGETVPSRPTAPLRVVNKTPSPTKPKSESGPSAPSNTDPFRLEDIPGLTASSSTRPSPAKPQAIFIPSGSGLAKSPPPRIPAPSTLEPLAPTLHGPRSPVPRGHTASPPKGPRAPLTGPRSPAMRETPQISLAAGLGSAHTKLRVVSGGAGAGPSGSRPSPFEITNVPLKDDENSPSPVDKAQSMSHLSAKRQRSIDQLTPRKRSESRSPLEPRLTDYPQQQLEDPTRVPSPSKRTTPRIPSSGAGRRTPRKTSGPLLSASNTPRKVSVASVASTGTVATITSLAGDVATFSHPDISSALDSMRNRIQESRLATKRLDMEVQVLKKHFQGDRRKRSLVAGMSPGVERNMSIPRSPQKLNMTRLLSSESDEYDSPGATPRAKAAQMDSMVMDETARGMTSLIDKLDKQLRAAQADVEVAGDHASQLIDKALASSAKTDMFRSQVTRAKETQDLLRQQLADAQIEVDTIYEAFNVELDGMFNDAQLPPSEAFHALRRDLEETKSSRNDLRLENMRLKRELEEANLKREQWARILRDQGVLQ